MEKYTNLHRTSFIQLEEATTHTNFQLPNDHTRVSYIINNIVNNDPDLRAAITSIRVNTDKMRSNFEAAVTFMLPVDLYIKHKEKLNKALQIHDVTLKDKTHSQTGVDFRWHTPDEYKLLTKDQKRELYDWQRTKEGKEVTIKHREPSGHVRKNNLKRKLQARINVLEIKIKESESRNKELRNQLPHYSPEGSKPITILDPQMNSLKSILLKYIQILLKR